MARIRNRSGLDLLDRAGVVYRAGAVVEVTGETSARLLTNPNFEPADRPDVGADPVGDPPAGGKGRKAGRSN